VLVVQVAVGGSGGPGGNAGGAGGDVCSGVGVGEGVGEGADDGAGNGGGDGVGDDADVGDGDSGEVVGFGEEGSSPWKEMSSSRSSSPFCRLFNVDVVFSI
jgi:hypothetical protein